MYKIEVNAMENNWFESLRIVDCNKTLKFKLDTGAHVNVIPEDIFQLLKISNKLEAAKISISNYGGQSLKVKGCCDLIVELGNEIYSLKFVIVTTDKKSAPILGIKGIQELKLLERKEVGEVKAVNNLLEEYADVFKGIGKIKGSKCEFKLIDNYKPVVVPCRKVPFQLMNKLKAELDKMVKDEVIVKVTEPTEFVNPIVLVNKINDNIRICLDPQTLNESLLREHYELPTFDEITRNVAGSKWFTPLDANKGFWQIELTENSSRYTTFATPFSRYRFLRLPFGVSNAPEIFHRTFTEIFEGIEGVKIYIDDIIIYAKTEKEHDEILKRVLERAKERGVRFNKQKCKLKQQAVKYIGHILTDKGIKMDSDKIEAINRIPVPNNAKELSRFLGMVTYVARFIPNLSSLTSNLRKLTTKDIQWDWLEIHLQEFNKLKKVLTKSPVLQYSDEKKLITLSVHSSKDGMGGVILQDQAPVAYASKSLTETQQGYAQIEKKMLAIVFGCQRFHQYLYGKHFIVETDHKPLETIFKKPLNQCPLRLQRLRISLQFYNFTVKYKPGTQMYFADALSRASYNDTNFDVIESELEAQINLINYASISPKKFVTLKQETLLDLELQELLKTIKEGWPNEKDNSTFRY